MAMLFIELLIAAVLGAVLALAFLKALVVYGPTEIEVCFYPTSDKQMVIAYPYAHNRAAKTGESPIVSIPIGHRQKVNMYSFTDAVYDEAEAMAAYAKIESLIRLGSSFREGTNGRA